MLGTRWRPSCAWKSSTNKRAAAHFAMLQGASATKSCLFICNEMLNYAVLKLRKPKPSNRDSPATRLALDCSRFQFWRDPLSGIQMVSPSLKDSVYGIAMHSQMMIKEQKTSQSSRVLLSGISNPMDKDRKVRKDKSSEVLVTQGSSILQCMHETAATTLQPLAA